MNETQILRKKLAEAEQKMEEHVSKCSVLRFYSEEEQQHNLAMIEYFQYRQQFLRAQLRAL